MSFKKEIAEKLNTLLKNNVEALEIYKKAEETVSDLDLKVFFANRVHRRSNFVNDLRTEILRYGQIPEDEVSAQTSLQNAWLSFKTLLSSNDAEIVLKECIDTDEKALEDYQELRKEKDLPPSLDKIFENHYNEIMSSLNKDKMYLKKVASD